MGNLLRPAAVLLWLATTARAMAGTTPLLTAPYKAPLLPRLHLLAFYFATALLVSSVVIVAIAIIVHRVRRHSGAALWRNGADLWTWLLVPLALLGVDLGLAGDRAPLVGQWLAPASAAVLEVRMVRDGSGWRFEYRTAGSTAIVIRSGPGNRLVLPAQRKVRLLLAPGDQPASIVVPELRIYGDAIAGYERETLFTAEREGLFHGESVVGGIRVPVVVEVMGEQRFEEWQAAAAAGIAPSLL